MAMVRPYLSGWCMSKRIIKSVMSPGPALAVLAVLAVLPVLLLLPGCVERKLIIRSEPSNATVILDGRNVGTTPYEVSFMHYGGREVLLAAPGHLRRRAVANVRPPLYQRFPIDFIAECLLPFTLVDEHVFTYRLKPMDAMEKMGDDDIRALTESAKKLKQRTRASGAPK